MPSPSRSARDERQANRSSCDASRPPADEAGDLIWPKGDPARPATSAELLTPEEFQAAMERGRVHQATGTYTEAENRAESPLRRGEAAGYSPDDIVAFYVARRGGDWRRGAYDLVKDAHAGNRPINRSLWDAVVTRAPRGYVRDGEVYRPAGSPPEGFVARKAVVIPSWAKVIALVANGIDGWPPVSDAVYSVEEFIKAGDGLQQRPGAGEWDVLVYAKRKH